MDYTYLTINIFSFFHDGNYNVTSWISLRIIAEPITYFSTGCEGVANLFMVFQLDVKNMGLNITIIVLNEIMSVSSRDIKLQEDLKIQSREKIY